MLDQDPRGGDSMRWPSIPGAATVLPFHPNARVLAMLEAFYVFAAALLVGLVLRRIVDRHLAKNDPRRLHIAQAILYGGVFVLVALSVWFRHR
jgi:hypothetical protein